MNVPTCPKYILRANDSMWPSFAYVTLSCFSDVTELLLLFWLQQIKRVPQNCRSWVLSVCLSRSSTSVLDRSADATVTWCDWGLGDHTFPATSYVTWLFELQRATCVQNTANLLSVTSVDGAVANSSLTTWLSQSCLQDASRSKIEVYEIFTPIGADYP